jgi:hypothetical protein
MPASRLGNAVSGARYSQISPVEFVRLMQTRRRLNVALRMTTAELDMFKGGRYNPIQSPLILPGEWD